MQRITVLAILISAIKFSTVFAVPVDGNCFLENQPSHENIGVIFVIDSTGNIADSVLTQLNGHYETDIGEGIYSIYFTEPGYAGHGIYNQQITGPTTIADVTISELPAGQTLTDTLSGELPAGTYLIENNIRIQTGDTLTIAPGSVFLFSFHYSFEIFGMLTAMGTASDSIYFVSASETVPWVSIIFRNGSSPESELSYCYITDADGSAINIYWTDITISHCTITENTANWGGGIYASYCDPIISDCIVTNNSAKHNGGGIYVTRSAPTIIDCIITGNECNWGAWGSGRGGGGITANHSSSPIITGCTIFGNRSYYHGGGISINDDSHPVITDCIITSNIADTTGGGVVSHQNCHPTMTNCIIDSNIAMKGGGICMGFNSTFTVDSCQINANSADTLGGGIYIFNSAPTFTNCTIDGNSADYEGRGGGAYCFEDSSRFEYCTFSNNNGVGVDYNYSVPIISYCVLTGSVDGVLSEESEPVIINCTIVDNDNVGILSYLSYFLILNTIIEGHPFGGIFFGDSTTATIMYSDFYDNGVGNFTGEPPDTLGDIVTINANGDSCDYFLNIFLDPLFDDPAAGNYQILFESPCIDAGDPTFPLDPDTTIVDMGAFYFDQQSIVPTKPLSLQPKTFRLHPPYPNPFNPTTTISYEIPTTSHIKLIIYNLLGRQVATLVDQSVQTGIHTITWNAGNYPSGIYFCRLESNGFHQTQKLLLLK